MTAGLLTWLWQGMAIASLVSVAFRLLPGVNAATRYLIWWSSVVALIGLGAMRLRLDSLVANVPIIVAGEPVPRAVSIQITPLPDWVLISLALAWSIGTLVQLSRILPGLHAIHRMKDRCTPFPRDTEEQLPLWREARVTGRAARLMLCEELPSAAVLGFHHPCIAIPPSFLTRLTASELDQIVLHEFGHVQRRDDWFGLVQASLDAALWIHPGAVWMSRRIRLEREVSCDDWVVSRTGTPRDYARCLTRVADSRRFGRTPAFASGLSGTGHLARRIDRLLDARRNARRNPSMAAATCGVLALIVVAAWLRTLPLLDDRPSSIVHRPSSETPTSGSGSDSDSGLPPQPVVSAETSRTTPANPEPGTANPDLGTANPAPRTQHPEPSKPGQDDARTIDDGRTMDDGRSTMDDVSVIPARAIAGSYEPLAASSIPARLPPGPRWQLAGQAGVELANAARRGGVGVAGTLTRASLSIARRF